MTDFEALLRRMVSAEVEFIVVGGVAATAHGSARLTMDLDVVYARSELNLERLVTCFGDARPYLRGAPPGLPFEWSARTLRNVRSKAAGALSVLTANSISTRSAPSFGSCPRIQCS